MPLPSDTKVVETSQGLVNVLQDLAGPHPGIRPAHAKGLLLKGTFVPTETAKSLSKASHFNNPSTPILGRFSNSTGFPELPDTDPNGNPRGFALRFLLAETPRRIHTDIVTHSVDAFPGTTGEEALALFAALRDGTGGDYIATHPKALAFVQTPKPTPVSFARQKYYAVNAFKLISAAGKETFIRYRVVPVAGEAYLDETELQGKSADFLFDEISERLSGLGGGAAVEFKLTAQVAEDGDVTNDNTVKWPEERSVVELGTIRLEGVAEDQAAQQKHIIFDPIPRVEGVEASDDPLLQVRAGVYLISGKERRSA
ncbi:hypothetical protein PFICI_12797 [Pestalotiopsis fici W106-1]|uniref:Catalase core domain-containing protein n=1 Tax=Pestalotiopsis fici (strain W106-1 / CGMCC3.15140) TaxID=1229662 RepID=W3WPR7_PESFW|nr:uncharacterized protein PFICI_12797 [Pestalotiopsis fici W106-1]ETS75853.1 hypothetical protein PFICI_12797 [Pestalotiopsis fici W106-1]